MVNEIPVKFVEKHAKEYLNEHTNFRITDDGAVYEKGLIGKKYKLDVAAQSSLDDNSGPFDFYVVYYENTYKDIAEDLGDYLESTLKTKYPNEDVNIYLVDNT